MLGPQSVRTSFNVSEPRTWRHAIWVDRLQVVGHFDLVDSWKSQCRSILFKVDPVVDGCSYER